MGYDYDNVIGAFHEIDLFVTTVHSLSSFKVII